MGLSTANPPEPPSGLDNPFPPRPYPAEFQKREDRRSEGLRADSDHVSTADEGGLDPV
jgi:hypothetical protein